MRTLPVLFSLALFFAAFLSFSIQPVLGKMLLPMVGGSPSGWIVAMAFFQLSLLAGYGFSYVLGRLSPWVHATGLLALYSAGFAFLPPHLPQIGEHGNISLEVMIALAKTILIPFLALTATTAALQRVFSATNHPTARDPYYLFVASNLGSFAGLLVYPFLLEPYTGLQQQSVYWQMIYISAVALITLSCTVAWKQRRPMDLTIKKSLTEKVPLKQIIQWLLLAFIPCSLSMGVTTLITTDVGGMPLFWVIPLGFYLLTFILAFARRTFVSTEQLNFLHVIAVLFVVISLGLGRGYQPLGNIAVFLFLSTLLLGIFFIIAWSCHRTLAQSRPATEHLTLYYFIIALGGALAGVLHGFIIPFLLPYVVEFPIVAILSVLVVTKVRAIPPKHNLSKIGFISLLALLAATGLKSQGYTEDYYTPLYFVFFFTALFLPLYPRLLMTVGGVAVVISLMTHYPGKVITQGRNFFGPYAVYDAVGAEEQPIRYLVHGSTVHGTQKITKGVFETQSNSGYYAQGNPIQEVFSLVHVKKLAVIGLGSGQMACYDRHAVTDFYEIDPHMLKVASKFFTYLKNCPPRDIFIGDGRRMIEKENRQYDVIMMDAFSSDTIPIHLVTREALAIYKHRLTKDGIILFHISNRYLSLAPPLGTVARAEKLQAYAKTYLPNKDKKRLAFPSQWLVIPMSDEAGEKLIQQGWKTVQPQGIPWSDDQSSLLSAVSVVTIY